MSINTFTQVNPLFNDFEQTQSYQGLQRFIKICAYFNL